MLPNECLKWLISGDNNYFGFYDDLKTIKINANDKIFFPPTTRKFILQSQINQNNDWKLLAQIHNQIKPYEHLINNL